MILEIELKSLNFEDFKRLLITSTSPEEVERAVRAINKTFPTRLHELYPFLNDAQQNFTYFLRDNNGSLGFE